MLGQDQLRIFLQDAAVHWARSHLQVHAPCPVRGEV
jgi:hypothetical protein